MLKKPEIMSPAGYWPQLRAAIESGADSVYFGLKHFTARAKVGFTLAELPEVFRTLHQRGVKGYVTFNTLVFEHELDEAARALEAIATSGADAIIVQDLGVLKLAKQLAPDLELHGSTQMSITDARGVRLAQELGADRVTLARELSLEEIRAIRSQTDCELEIFVHGALCVAYSGQCFSSEAWGGRSANRGQCAQACRLPYELIVDGEVKPLGEARYLLSPGDLYTLRHIPDIVGLGVSALKIEGRYKDADYVALTTAAYRKAVDEAWAGQTPQVTKQAELQLEQVYSRGLGAHFLSGTNHQAVVEGRAPRHRGVWMGRVTRVQPDHVVIEASTAHRLAPLKPGDGIVFDAASWRSPEEPEQGGRIFEVLAKGRTLELRFGNGAVDFQQVRAGDLVWRTHDPDLDRAVRPYLDPSAPVRRQPLRIEVRAQTGEPLRSVWSLTAQAGVRIEVESEIPCGTAQNRALNEELLREQFGRLGNTAYELAELELEAAGSPFVPASVLNQMRRLAVDRLSELQGRQRSVEIRNAKETVDGLRRPHQGAAEGIPELHLLVRAPDQLDAAIEFRPSTITLDYLDLYGLKPSVDRVKQAGLAVRVASPRVLKPGEEKIGDFLLKLECPILVRAAGLMSALRGQTELIGDFSLNAANSITAAMLLEMGLSRVTPTHDLNAEQITDLARRAGSGCIEAVAYQHLPVFHTEHCVFCRFLSTGTSYRDCGRPCEKHRVSIRDVAGRAHPVLADVGCRNTVFAAEAQEASLHLEDWLKAGVRHFRLEFAHESAAETGTVAERFRDALHGRISFQRLHTDLRKAAPQGTAEGSLFVPRDYLTLPVLQ